MAGAQLYFGANMTEPFADQIEKLKRGSAHIRLLRPATVADGILQCSASRRERAIELFDRQIGQYNTMRMVPASGAASRMFKAVFSMMANPEGQREAINRFFEKAEEFPFFEEWMQAAAAADVETFEAGLISKMNWLRLLVENDGLGYAHKPKALIPFHRYDEPATPLHEHVYETNLLSRMPLHFTLSPEHVSGFEATMNAIGKQVDLPPTSYSFQNPETDTVALTAKGELAMNGDRVLRRPGGHGALLENLNKLDAELVFIKNIDNVCHRQRVQPTIWATKMLGGLLLELRADLKELHRQIGQRAVVDHPFIKKLNKKWMIRIPHEYPTVAEYIQRPVRVCAMVRNDGEPGGGPFWCADAVSGESLQIVEQQQIDAANAGQMAILKSSTHFNPVFIWCCTGNLHGEKLDLSRFVDHQQYFVSEKSLGNETLKVLEWPGLWNGAMAHWITLFVEIPSTAFNPVKEITDLHRPGHKPMN